MKLLIVDDDKNMCYLLKSNFERRGDEVECAESAPKALQILLQYHPDVIIVDVLMPGLTGFQLIGAIRRSEQTRNIPIIFTSITPGPPGEGVRIGLLDFIRKPIDKHKFNKIIETIKVQVEEPTVLIIDDNTPDRKLLKIMLEKRKCNVIEANDGDTGLQVATEKQPDLILMDYLIPFVDGIELTKMIKQNEKTSHIPIVLVTAYMPASSETKTVIAGSETTSVKTYTFEEIFEKINNLVLKI